MTVGMILEWFLKSLILILGMTLGFAYVTLYERKVLARMQVRIGPNRAGPWGLLQPIADAFKLIFKEELIPAEGGQVPLCHRPGHHHDSGADHHRRCPVGTSHHHWRSRDYHADRGYQYWCVCTS